MNIEIVDYSEKAIAVFGDTTLIKEELKSLGGRFNPRLNYGEMKRAGWILKASLRSAVEKLCDKEDVPDNEVEKTSIDKEPNNLNTPMELHIAIKNLVKYQGEDFITSEMFLNALADFNAYEQHSALKGIMRILVQDGYIKKLQNCLSWNTSTLKLVTEVVNTYAINEDLVSYAMQSVAYALGKCSEPPHFSVIVPESSQSIPQSSSQKTTRIPVNANNLTLTYEQLDKKPESFVVKYKEEAEAYMDSIIELKNDWQCLGAKINISSLYEIYSNNSEICLNFEIEGKIAVKFKYSFLFKFVIYDIRDKLLYQTYGTLDKKANRGYSIVQTNTISEMYFKYIGNIGKIVVYWETI